MQESGRGSSQGSSQGTGLTWECAWHDPTRAEGQVAGREVGHAAKGLHGARKAS